MKLEIKHLAAYLPYNIEVSDEGNNEINNLSYYNYNFLKSDRLFELKPILRPLLDLTKEIEHNGEKFVPIVNLLILKHIYFYNINKQNRYGCIEYEKSFPKAWFKFMASMEILIYPFFNSLKNTDFWIIEKLLEWHFDIFGLIENNLAINKNELENI